MSVAIPLPRALPADRPARSEGVRLLQIFVLLVMVIPSDAVLPAVGAAGYPASLFGVFVCGLFFVTIFFGFHDAARATHPIRGVLCVIWIALLASYIAMDRGHLSGVEVASADRMLIRFAVVTGIALVAAEWLRSMDDVVRVVRVLCWGGAFCGFVAVLQYWGILDLSQYLRQIPGFAVNQDNPSITLRGGLNRVAGTATSSIEMGVTAAMLIPVAVWLGLYDRDKTTFKRWAPLTLIVIGVATSVSRSAIVSVVAAFTTLVVLMPPRQRLAALCGLPFALAGVFMSAHGLIGVLATFFASAKNDPSVQYRTHDYPVAEQMWQSAPWFGHGPGTWIPANSLNIFDNQYLSSAVEIGAIGVLALTLFLLGPAVIALVARRSSRTPDLRLLCAALAAAGFAATTCSLTFDSMSFPMYVNAYAVVIGLIGASWRLVRAERTKATNPTAPLSSTRTTFSQPAVPRPRRAEP